jgi:hypothetical protein
VVASVELVALSQRLVLHLANLNLPSVHIDEVGLPGDIRRVMVDSV